MTQRNQQDQAKQRLIDAGVPEEHIHMIQGQAAVSAKGLVHLAHERYGSRFSIDSELIVAPSEENGQTAVIKSTIIVNHEDGTVQKISGIGDANPSNVGRNIAPHFIRMAETRGEARAHRKLLNVAALAVEELGGDSGGNEEPAPARQSGNSRPPRATRAQVSRITELATELARGDSESGVEKVVEAAGCELRNLDRTDADGWIARLEKQAERTRS